jgi:hypothetical protein
MFEPCEICLHRGVCADAGKCLERDEPAPAHAEQIMGRHGVWSSHASREYPWGAISLTFMGRVQDTMRNRWFRSKHDAEQYAQTDLGNHVIAEYRHGS